MNNNQDQLYILGSTGSIGVNTLDVAQHLGISIYGLCANNSVEKLAEQAINAQAKVAIIANETHYKKLHTLLSGSSVEARAGDQAIVDLMSECADAIVVTAIVGAAGLKPTMEACKHARRICIANKEPLVMAGSLIMDLAARHHTEILPIDSEHSAIFQCLEGHTLEEVDRIILSASGGPLRTLMDLSQVSKEQALKHPNWSMGAKISIDSASLMNKALEIIEACHLFGCPAEKIEVLVHPESIIHSMVSYLDGSVIAQMGRADMRTPIQYALTYPIHCQGQVSAPDFKQLASLHFEDVDHQRFPSINMAYDAIKTGGLAPCAFNAANECAVEKFLNDECSFQDIFSIIEKATAHIETCTDVSLSDILNCDQEIRQQLASAQ